MHVHELVNRHKSRKHEQHQIYRTILQDVYTKIKEKDEKRLYNLVYRVPSVVYGNASYKSKTCIIYIVKKLVENEFVSFPYKDNLVYVDWSVVRNIVESSEESKNKSKHDSKYSNKHDSKQVTFALPFKE